MFRLIGSHVVGSLAALGFAWLTVTAPSSAATLCVNPSGSGSCTATIASAVAGASPQDTITVAPGTYHEAIVIDKPLSLVGAGSETTIIDASGLPNGVNIDGHTHPGLAHVSVTGFTVKNANFEGILATDSSFITVANNHLTGNDRSLVFPGNMPACPGLPPYFMVFQSYDCGEAIHLSGVDHSTVSNNVVDQNAGGILLSDDTGATHDNLVIGNTVQNNAQACGITLASHINIPGMPQVPLRGVYHNTVASNNSSYNGLGTTEGAGIGMFAAAQGGQTWGNVVIGNTVIGNALPGVSMHSHSPSQNLNDNQIVANQISGNGPDRDPGITVPTGIDVFADERNGAPPITGTVITQNIIREEGIDIAVATSGGVIARFNALFDEVGLANLGAGLVDASLNWWNCSIVGASGCGTVSGLGVSTTPWLPTFPESARTRSVPGSRR